LYEEIILLKHFFKGRWVVENVVSYYKPLIKPYRYREHYFWSDFIIDGKKGFNRCTMGGMDALRKLKGFDIIKYKKVVDERQVLRNCTEPETGLNIFNMAFKNKQSTLRG